MDNFLVLTFWLSAALILHTYLFYPFFMILFYSGKKRHRSVWAKDDALPEVNVIVAAHNEQNVIRKKIESVFAADYPAGKLKVIVGSDASGDNTDDIVEALGRENPRIEFVRFAQRIGKINIVNELQTSCTGEILILTDANVIFTRDTIYELVKYFRDEQVGIVAANIIKQSSDNKGISYQEKKYLSLENRIKAAESNAFGMIMGAEGGCYAIRNNLFSKVPSKFIVDDFFITFRVMNRRKFTLFSPNAICFEDVHSETAGEYRRKVRISSGNFQNLFFFRGMLIRFWKSESLAFLSHKVLRWFTPFLLLSGLFSAAVLSGDSLFYRLVFSLQLLGFLVPLIDHLVGFGNRQLKFISHFYMMNFALLAGFLKFVKGIKSSVWEPVKRNV